MHFLTEVFLLENFSLNLGGCEEIIPFSSLRFTYVAQFSQQMSSQEYLQDKQRNRSNSNPEIEFLNILHVSLLTESVFLSSQLF